MPRIRADQIRGVSGDTIKNDVQRIEQQTRSYQSPVANKNSLPKTDNTDGDIRLALDVDELYIWDAATGVWKEHADKTTETRTLVIPVTRDGQVKLFPDIPVGIENGLASIETVSLSVNGIIQTKHVDYTLETSSETPPKLIINWESTDFQLEVTDDIMVTYDVLLLK